MDDSDDPIKKLLEQTGWSYAEVLKKLEKYKNPAGDSLLKDSATKQSKADETESHDSKPANVEAIESRNDAIVENNKETYNVEEGNTVTSCNVELNKKGKTIAVELDKREKTIESELDKGEKTIAVELDKEETTIEIELDKEEKTIEVELDKKEKTIFTSCKETTKNSNQTNKNLKNCEKGNTGRNQNVNRNDEEDDIFHEIDIEDAYTENENINKINTECGEEKCVNRQNKMESSTVFKNVVDEAKTTKHSENIETNNAIDDYETIKLISENMLTEDNIIEHEKELGQCLEPNNTTSMTISDIVNMESDYVTISKRIDENINEKIITEINNFVYETTKELNINPVNKEDDLGDNIKNKGIKSRDETDVAVENVEGYNKNIEDSVEDSTHSECSKNEKAIIEVNIENNTSSAGCAHNKTDFQAEEAMLENLTVKNNTAEEIIEVQALPERDLKCNFKKQKSTMQIKNTLANQRLRLIRKYKNLHKKRLKRKTESNSNIVESEDIRSRLREQLELLRTKRNITEPLVIHRPIEASCGSRFLQHNKNRLNNITSTLLQKLNGNMLDEASSDSNDDNSDLADSDDTNNDNIKRAVTSPEHILSNESDFMIINVVGGYKSPTPEPQYHDDNSDLEDSCNLTKQDIGLSDETDQLNDDALDLLKQTAPSVTGIKPTKTNDVTKIKGWKNKKFAIAKERQKKPSEKLLQILTDDYESDSGAAATGSHTELSTEGTNLPSVETTDGNMSMSKSAFVSDALDQYLTENSELNISYEVPKLEAEQTITKTYIDIKFPEFPQESRSPSFLKSKDSYKPKTLAEKRKMLIESQAPQIKDFMVSMSSKQRRYYEEGVLNMRKKLIDENVPFTRRCFVASTSITNTSSFVVYNGKRYRVPYNKPKEIVVEIKDKRKMYKSARTQPFKKYKAFEGYPKKPSLLNSLKVEVKMEEEYNPSEWETVRVKLPKLFLEVVPEIRKRIDPKIEHFIEFNDIMNKDRIDFALSALKVKNSGLNRQRFTFPLKYVYNQDSVIMRRRKSTVVDIPKQIPKSEITETDGDIAETITVVMNKLLDYIEISEIRDDIIKEETSQENDENPDVPPGAEQPATFEKKRRGRRKALNGPKNVRKTTLEMKRLSCKIVSISLDEEQSDINPCQKEFCKLGCVCKSIECNSTNRLPTHCGLSGCMFNCTCNYKRDAGQNISLSTGIFSEGIINRLQDEAKKNLAKVEKEFTQTIIKTNNQIIMVGDSKERRKRTTKMPKKYDDYVEEDFIEPPPKLSLVKKNHIIEETYENNDVKPCSVKLLKHNLSDIIPFCMVHMLYKCHCQNKAVFDNNADDTNIVGCTVLQATAKAPLKPDLMKNKVRNRNDKTFNKEIYSSRTRGLSTSYYIVRNKSISHKNKLIKSSRKLQSHLESYLHENAEKIMKDEDEPSVVVEPVQQIPQEVLPDNVKRKRKQSLVVLEDHGNDNVRVSSPELEINAVPTVSETEREPKIQRRKIRLNTKQTGQEFINIAKAEPSPEKSPTPEADRGKTEFLKLISKNNTHLRLLPWSTLAARYGNGTFQLWYTNYIKSPQLIITENGRRPSTNHYNIKLFEQLTHESAIPSDIIRWLITRRVPFGKTGDQILLILAFNKNYWKICGICEKTSSDNSKSGDSLSISLIDAYGSVEDSEDEEPPVIELKAKYKDEKPPEVHDDIVEEAKEENTEALVHENLQENKKVMYCTKKRFQTKKLSSDCVHDNVLKIRQVLWAPIPSVTLACKWRVVCMNLGFAYLSLSRSSYTIKYDDIMKAVSLAQKEKITIVLKSKELQKNYPHRNFGIYCVHNYSDKIFIGPYFLNENHDLDTLSFVNSVLVNTNLFNQIKGKTVPGSGFWFHQVTNSEDKSIDDDVTIVQDSPALIDLTCDSDEDSLNAQNSPADSPPKEATLLERVLTPLRSDIQEETEKAEKALDALLKTGQLNVNKTIVSLKNLDTVEKTQDEIVATTDNATSNSTTDEPHAVSESDDDDALIIDVGIEAAQNFSQEMDDDLMVIDSNSIENSKRRYLVTNVPKLGYITAYQHKNYLNVICPITQKTKRFPNDKIAIGVVERVLARRFILVPPTFKIECKMVEKVESNVAPLNRRIFSGYHIVGTFGVKDILNSNLTELKELGLNKTEIGYVLLQREQKLLLPPISELAKLLRIPLTAVPLAECLANILEGTLKELEILQKNKALFTTEKIGLETKKTVLAERCSKLMANLPPEQRNKAQQELEQILNFSTRDESASCITTIVDSPTESVPPGTLNTPTCMKEKAKPCQELDSEVVELLDGPDDAPSGPQILSKHSLPIPKIAISRKPFVGDALMSNNKVEILKKPNPRSLLSGNIKDGNLTNKYVVVTRKRSLASTTLSASTVNVKKGLFQIKPVRLKEKVLVKDLPILVRKDMIKTINSNILQQKAKLILPKVTPSASDVNIPQSVMTAVSVLNKVSKISCPTLGSLLTTSANSASAVQSVAASSVGPVSSVSFPKPKLANVVSPTSLPFTRVPLAPKPTKSNGDLKNNSMATITPLPKTIVVNSAVPKGTPNYIAIKEGNSMKYFQLVKEKKVPGLQPVITLKRPSSSIIPQPPAKKVITGTSLLSNQNDKTET